LNQSHSISTVLTLGTAQDGGYPHTGCRGACCVEAWNNPSVKRLVSSIAVLSDNDCWLIDITPDFRYQLKMIETKLNDKPLISGIFISHAHMGHYIGLLDLGLEVMNTDKIPVYVMPKMKAFLEENAPFTQLIELNNIILKKIEKDKNIQLNENITIKPFQVPHRNEFSETIGFMVQSPDKSLVYIPDIDSWDKWDVDIIDIIQGNDILLLDGTFYDSGELQKSNIQDVPHPFIQDSLKKFSHLEEVDRKKVYFTHLNHTNNVLKADSRERNNVLNQGFHIASDNMTISM